MPDSKLVYTVLHKLQATAVITIKQSQL